MTAEVHLLGRFDIRADTGQSLVLPAGKVSAIVAALAFAPNHRHSREFLAALLWGDYPEQQARGSLRFALSVLRKALAHSQCLSLFASKEAVWLEVASLRVDALQFETLANSNRAVDWQGAADLYQGDFLEGLTVRSEQFEEWVRAHRTGLRGLFERTLDKLLAHAQASGQEELAVQIAQRHLTFDPLREDIHRILIAIFRGQGRAAAALKQYDWCAELLKSELNARPDRETSRLIEGLRSSPTPLTAASKTPRSTPVSCQILVPPFRAESRGETENELTIALAESIRFALARLSDFKLVIPPASWSQKDGQGANSVRRAGAGFVVNGTLKIRDGRVEATIGLAETPCSPWFWSRRYSFASSELDDLDSIAWRKIVPPLRHFIQRKQLQRLRRIAPAELDGFQLGLLARAEVEKMTRTSLSAAVGLARRANQSGMISSLSCSMLALARVFQVRMGWADNRSDALSEAFEAAGQAINFNFRDPVGHGVLGLVHLWNGSHVLALKSANRATTLNPSRADVLHWKGLVLDFAGEHEQAIEHHSAALDLDPLHGAAFATINALSGAYYELGAYEHAAAWAKRSIKVNPGYRRSHAVLAASLAQMGDEGGCALALKVARTLDPSLSLRTQLSGFAYKNMSEVKAWERGFRKAGLR
jgi:DNA-binding SARP family transcriptional activator/tetratricopeptide (TPR) repeat protein